MMRKIFLIAAFHLFCFKLFAQTTIKAVTMDEVVKMADTSSVPVIINVWASWCPPCVHEIPYFENYVNEIRGKVKLLLVSLDFKEDYPKGLQSFVQKNNYTSTVVWLKETNADIFCPKLEKGWDGAIPVTLMINKNKNYRRFYSTQLTEPQFIQALKELVE